MKNVNEIEDELILKHLAGIYINDIMNFLLLNNRKS